MYSIIFRAFQGIGGSGLYSLGLSSLPEVTPVKHLGVASALASVASVCASVLGPVIGGAITSNTTWRWVFWFKLVTFFSVVEAHFSTFNDLKRRFSIPGGITLIAMIFFVFPDDSQNKTTSVTLFAKLDWPGMILSLAASILIIVSLEGGGSQFPWSSPTIIILFIASALCWLAFASWEYFLTMKDVKTSKLPVFPTSLVGHRVIGFAFL